MILYPLVCIISYYRVVYVPGKVLSYICAIVSNEGAFGSAIGLYILLNLLTFSTDGCCFPLIPVNV